jgi:hypothetical protein
MLGAALPDAQLDVRLPQRGLQLLDLLGELALARVWPGGPPSAKPALPLSRNCCFQREIDCSDALPRRAASTIVISPLMTARTSRYLSSREKTGERAKASSLHEEPDVTPTPEFAKQDRRTNRRTLPASRL